MRLFVAAEVPSVQRASLAKALEPLKPQLPSARWTSPASWHVTLKFLGEVTETQLDEVGEVLEEVGARGAAFSSRFTVPGAFPSLGRPRVLWMGLADERHGFRNLAGRIERKFEKAGFAREGRVFHPHLTLARFPGETKSRRRRARGPEGEGGLHEFVAELSAREIDRGTFRVGQIVLFESHLRAGGAVYERRMAVRLSRTEDPASGGDL